MNRHYRVIVCCLVLIIVLCGCARWQYIKMDDQIWRNPPFEAILPKAWVKLNAPGTNLLYLTKDGIFLQEVKIYQLKLNNEKVFPITKKKITEDMLESEIAELIINEFALNRDVFLNFDVLENRPARIDGVDGFKLVYTYNNENFLKRKTVYYGFIYKKKYYVITYIAAAQHYFDEDIDDFEWFMDRLRIVKKK